MSDWTVVVAPSAAKQVEGIREWWRVNRLGAPDLFESEVESAVLRLARSPRMGKTYRASPEAGVRRLLLTGSRYHLYYELEAPARIVRVIAVWHAERGQGPELHRSTP